MKDSLTTTETFVWRNITIQLKHEVQHCTMLELNHLEILVIEPERAPLPVTETGYRSHFYYGAPMENVVQKVTAWLDEEAVLNRDWQLKQLAARQMSLF